MKGLAWPLALPVSNIMDGIRCVMLFRGSITLFPVKHRRECLGQVRVEVIRPRRSPSPAIPPATTLLRLNPSVDSGLQRETYVFFVSFFSIIKVSELLTCGRKLGITITMTGLEEDQE